MHVCRLLSENEEIRSELDRRFRYIMVDEYQDTNLPQYKIVRALSHDYPNLCATGDPDQSIYGWRGAEIGNILRFEQDFPDAHVIRLEQNYRSTPEILRAADGLISHNTKRKQKTLFTENPTGAPVESLCFETHTEEALSVALSIANLAQDEQRPWSDFAVFYRVNALSRELERALTRLRIPYQVAAGVAFYERAEVKDLLAYLRLIHNPADRAAFLRVVNSPVRGIGKTTLGKLADWADHSGLTLLAAARRAGEFPGLKARAVTALRRFADLIDEFSSSCYGNVSTFWGRARTDQLRIRVQEQHSRNRRAARGQCRRIAECLPAIRRAVCRRPDPGGALFWKKRRSWRTSDSIDDSSGPSDTDDVARGQGP